MLLFYLLYLNIHIVNILLWMFILKEGFLLFGSSRGFSLLRFFREFFLIQIEGVSVVTCTDCRAVWGKFVFWCDTLCFPPLSTKHNIIQQVFKHVSVFFACLSLGLPYSQHGFPTLLSLIVRRCFCPWQWHHRVIVAKEGRKSASPCAAPTEQ